MNWTHDAGPLGVPSNISSNDIYRNFCTALGFEDRLGEPLELLTILNAFTLGLCVSPGMITPHGLSVFHLEDLLNVPDLRMLESLEHHS